MPLTDQQLRALESLHWFAGDDYRATGRTTVQCVYLIREAMANPNRPVWQIDHYLWPGNGVVRGATHLHEWFSRTMREFIDRCGLSGIIEFRDNNRRPSIVYTGQLAVTDWLPLDHVLEGFPPGDNRPSAEIKPPPPPTLWEHLTET